MLLWWWLIHFHLIWIPQNWIECFMGSPTRWCFWLVCCWSRRGEDRSDCLGAMSRPRTRWATSRRCSLGCCLLFGSSISVAWTWCHQRFDSGQSWGPLCWLHCLLSLFVRSLIDVIAAAVVKRKGWIGNCWTCEKGCGILGLFAGRFSVEFFAQIELVREFLFRSVLSLISFYADFSVNNWMCLD